MSLPLDLLFNQVAKAIGSHASPNTPGPSYDANPLLGGLQGMFNQFANANGQQFNTNPQYGDPQEFHNQYGQVASSDQDPFGDPGAQANAGGQNIASSDEDPFGDPGAQR